MPGGSPSLFCSENGERGYPKGGGEVKGNCDNCVPGIYNFLKVVKSFTAGQPSLTPGRPFFRAGKEKLRLGRKTEIGITALSSGVYFIEVKGAEGVVRKRVVKM